MAQAEPLVVEEPEPRVRFRRFGDSSLDFELLCWIPEPRLRGQVLDALNTKIYKLFAEHGIEIPFPQQDLHLRDLDGLKSALGRVLEERRRAAAQNVSDSGNKPDRDKTP